MSINRRLLVCAWVFAVVGLSSACGGDQPSGTARPSNQVSTSESSPSAAPPPGATDAKAFCELVEQQRAVLQGTELSGLLAGGGGTPDAWKAYLDKVTTMNQQLVDAAPAEIQASVKALQDSTLELKSMLTAADYDVSKVGSAKLVKLLQTPERKEATAAIVAYVKTQCGIDLTKL